MKNRLEFLATGFSSLCCIVPLILLGVGLGGTMLPMFFVSYKVPFLTIAFVALSLAWFLYARDRKRCAAEGCALVGSKLRLWMLGGNTAVIVVFALLSLTPVGVTAGNTLFPQPELQALIAEGAPAAGESVNGKDEAAAFTAAVSRSMKADGAVSKAEGASASKTDGAKLKRIALHVEGMS